MDLSDVKAAVRTDPFMALDRLRSEFQEIAKIQHFGGGSVASGSVTPSSARSSASPSMSMRKAKTEPHSLSSLREASSRSSERSRLSGKVVEESFSPVSLRDGLSPRDGLSARRKTSPELLETQVKEKWLQERLAEQDAELERLRAALAAAGRAVELASKPSSANGSPELEPKPRPDAGPALPEPTATPLLCATALRHTVSACGEGLFCSAATRALEAQGSEGDGEGERPEESRTRLARATDSLWAEILQQQALRLTQLESENQSLRWRADRLRKTHEPGELRSLLAAQGEVVAQLVPSEQPRTPVEATSDAYEAQIQKACLMRRLQSPHAEPLQLLDESLAFSAGRLCEDSRWQEQIHRDALATVEALLLERERLRLMRMPASGVADSLARAEDLCRALSDEVEENQVGVKQVDSTPAAAKVSSRRPSFQGQMPSEVAASNSFYTRSAQDVEKTPRTHNAREVVGSDRTPPRRPSPPLLRPRTVSSPVQAPAAMKQGPTWRQRLNSQPAPIARQPPSFTASHRATPRGAPSRSSFGVPELS